MGKKCIQQNAACFTIVNKKLSKDLANLGMFRAKSLTLVFPTESQLPKEFISSFILGYFDGDGTISLSTDKRNRLVAWFSIISSKQFCKDMKIILEKYFGIKLKYFSKKTKTAIVHTMKIQTIKDMFDFMYQNNKFYMLRKYDKFIKFFDWRKQYIDNHIGVFEGKWVKELT